MDIPNFKDIIQKLGVIKSYSSLLLPVGIGLLAVIVFVFTPLMGNGLKKRIERESISVGRQISSLSDSVVAADQWKVEQAHQAVYENDANRIALLARQSTKRELLSYKMFPEPKDTSVLIFKEFGQRFCEAIDGLIVRLNARECPTSTELDSALRKAGLSVSYTAPTTSSGMSYSRPGSGVDASVIDILCRSKAKSASIYANPADLSGYKFWKEYEYAGMEEAVKNCWYGQLTYWIIEDVVDTIAVMNSGSDSIFTSPVKRLMSVNFSAAGQRFGIAGGATDSMPHYVVSAGQGITATCTGRFCNDDMDIVHFNISVVIDIKEVLPFMQQLCSAKRHKFRGFSGDAEEQQFEHNQITVLESNISSINLEDGTHNLYRYGDDAVVKLDLVCEYIFDKDGYEEIKPQSVKESPEKTSG